MEYVVHGQVEKAVLATTILMFLLSTAQLAAFFGEFLVQIKEIMLESAPSLDKRIVNSQGPEEKLIVTDTILLLFRRRYCNMEDLDNMGEENEHHYSPFSIMFSLIITTILEPHVSASVRITIATQATSAATNTIATGLIAYKTWWHRRLLRLAFGRSSLATTQILQILFLLVESGYIIISVVAITTYGPWLIAANTIDYVISRALGLYPTVIIILVEQRRAVWDYPALSGIISVLQFAPESGSHTDTDDQTQSVSHSTFNGVSGNGGRGRPRNGEKSVEEIV
ncbi:hypothetical protein BDZ94DRAFT_1312015 [Collybia nuda]|uniref:Uncharacterized protein n=1 Tax=Collybia nuda TaxID=64659 RepID=A0A9P5Y204_9AGAR|nr:hypothetical protein BDZ94DRAFT_1312015 [Collybia nuda]